MKSGGYKENPAGAKFPFQAHNVKCSFSAFVVLLLAMYVFNFGKSYDP